LYGSGRWYINDIILRNIGERARYFLDEIRFHPGPTSMVYSGHVAIKYPCAGLQSPEVASYILEAVRSGFADLIFVYRHPLDSLLTNWVWWRTLFRDNRLDSVISKDYKNIDDLCALLERNFLEFKALAEGEPVFFWAQSGPRFLSFPEFVEETELYIQSATLALRLEDFMIDPLKEFSRIAELMSISLDSNRLNVDRPKTKASRYLAVAEKVPQFRNFIDNLDDETKRRIERIGYSMSV
jgi:hypothetical protein